MLIHFFKDGDINYSYEESWKKFCPNAVFKKWDSTNLPVDKYPILQRYIDRRKWSALSDFTRRYSIYSEGGIYLDYDIELIKPIDDLIYDNFVCIESKPTYANTAVCGGQKGNEFFKQMLDSVVATLEKGSVPHGMLETWLGVQITTGLVKSLAGIKTKANVELPDEYITKIIEHNVYGSGTLITLPKDFFFPYNWNEKFKPDCITKNTRGIHWWKKNW